MARVKFSRDYNHRWASGAETAYKNNGEYTVKREVADKAVKLGAAQELPGAGAEQDMRGRHVDDAKPKDTLPRNLPTELADPPALTPNLHEPDKS